MSLQQKSVGLYSNETLCFVIAWHCTVFETFEQGNSEYIDIIESNYHPLPRHHITRDFSVYMVQHPTFWGIVLHFSDCQKGYSSLFRQVPSILSILSYQSIFHGASTCSPSDPGTAYQLPFAKATIEVLSYFCLKFVESDVQRCIINTVGMCNSGLI